MDMFGKKKAKINPIPYDKENLRPVIRCSICNGEQIAGFKDSRTGKFEEIMLIRNSEDLNQFMKMYGLASVTKEY